MFRGCWLYSSILDHGLCCSPEKGDRLRRTLYPLYHSGEGRLHVEWCLTFLTHNNDDKQYRWSFQPLFATPVWGKLFLIRWSSRNLKDLLLHITLLLKYSTSLHGLLYVVVHLLVM